MAESAVGRLGWERTMLAVEKVKDRLKRVTQTLAEAEVPYAVVGGNAVAEWVGRVDETAVRNTRDVDILIRRADLGAITAALEKAGFIHGQSLGGDFFLDGPQGRAKDAVHIVFAGEKVQPNYVTAAPDVVESERAVQFQVVSLDALVKMKLNAFRLEDRVHLLDMIDVGLVDATWLGRLPTELAARLQQLLDKPDA